MEELAAKGTDFEGENNRLWEPDVAAGPRTVMTVFNHQRVPGGNRIGYAFRNASGVWTEGLTPDTATDGSTTFTVFGFGDVSVAYDHAGETSSADGGFLCAAFAVVPGSGGADEMVVLVNHYTPGAGWGDNWVEIDRRAWVTGSFPFDKPFLVAGEDDEFYVLWYTPDDFADGFPASYKYGRTTNGGNAPSDWTVGHIVRTVPPFRPIVGNWATHPAVWNDGNLLIVYDKNGSGKYRFMEGVDQPSGPGVDFSILNTMTSSGLEPLELGVDAQLVTNLRNQVAGVESGGFLPQVCADPTNSRRFYIAYHDRAAGTGDVNVFVNTITRVGGLWYFGVPTQLPNPAPLSTCDPDDPDTDQFLPMLSVDSEGRVHILYYDDRNFCQEDTVLDDFAKFDVVYAVSCNGGQSFQTALMKPASAHGVAYLDYEKEQPNWDVREYNGLTWTETPFGDIKVWTAFAGNSDQDSDPNDNFSVIFAIGLGF